MTEKSNLQVLIAGGSGLIGSRLISLLTENNFKVSTLSRKPSGSSQFHWNPDTGENDAEAIRQADVIINLAGESIAGKRWSEKRKQQIISSRVKSARLLAEAISKHNPSIKLVIQASAIGYYGDSGNKTVDEHSPRGTGFLSESTEEWESAADAFGNVAVRTVLFRIGIVLSSQGGALKKIIMPFYLGSAVGFGNGSQYISWIHIDDLCRMMLFAIRNESMNGIYNAVAPNPVTNREMTNTLRNVKFHFTIPLYIPAFLLRLVLGEMADVVLTGSKVSSQKITAAGFEFTFRHLSTALKNILQK